MIVPSFELSLDGLLADPRAASRALDCADAHESLLAFCGLIEIPGAPIDEDPDEEGRLFKPVELPQASHHRLLIEKLEAVERGDIKRLMVFMPPGSAKSTYASVVFPVWFMGRRKRRNVIVATYASDLARKIGRRARSILKQPTFREVFGTGLSADSAAADEWALDNENEFMGGGILSGITGNRADLIVIDDPIKGRQEADSETIRARTKAEYEDSIKTRLKPGGRIVLIQCMIGSTQVLMADGTLKQLRDIAVGDDVASHWKGRLVSRKVLNWANQGRDCVFAIKTKSGITVTANARHPFLVNRDGDLHWVRLKNLKPGDQMVRAIGASGETLSAQPTGAPNALARRGSATPTTTSGAGPAASGRPLSTPAQGATLTYGTGMGSASPTTKPCSPSRAVGAPSATSHQDGMSGLIGAASSALTTATTKGRSEGCSATTATSRSVTARPSAYCSQQLDTYATTLDAIVEIVPAGAEDVFDIQVEATENFIANGLVSHNTRWHEDDLAGGLLPKDYAGESGPILCRDGQVWEVLRIPAQADKSDDPLGRKIGEMLWTEWFTEEHWASFRAVARTWSALFQQSPTPGEGTFFERGWFRRFRLGDEPRHLRKYLVSDHAPTDGEDSDPNVGRIFGLSETKDVYLLDGFNAVQKMDKTATRLIALVKKHQPFAWFPEDDNNWKTAAPFIEQQMRAAEAFCRIAPMPPQGADKATKAQSIQGMAAIGMVWIPEGPEGDAIIDECVKFPAGKHDEEVDVLGIMGRAIAMAHPAIVPPSEPEPGPPRGINEMTFDEAIEQGLRPQLDRV